MQKPIASAALSSKRSGVPDPIDVHVGSRLKLRRKLLGLSQEQMGKALGLTFQQIQKYERGANRMGASRLHQMAGLLNVPIAWFFQELSSPPPSRFGFSDSKQASLEGAPAANALLDAKILYQPQTLDLIRAFYRITDSKQRRKVLELVKSMADKEE